MSLRPTHRGLSDISHPPARQGPGRSGGMRCQHGPADAQSNRWHLSLVVLGSAAWCDRTVCCGKRDE